MNKRIQTFLPLATCIVVVAALAIVAWLLFERGNYPFAIASTVLLVFACVYTDDEWSELRRQLRAEKQLRKPPPFTTDRH